MFFNDIFLSVKDYKKWLYLSYFDIYKRYRRSKLGQIWITLSTMILTLSITVIYAKLFRIDYADFLVHISTNLCYWFFVRECIQDSTNLFVENKVYLFNEKWNHLTMVLRVLSRNIIIYLHNLLFLIPVHILYNQELTFIGFVIYIFNFLLILPLLLFICTITSIICARFRDVSLVVSNLLQLLFFITPILFKKDLLGDYTWIIELNIFAIILEFVNYPLYAKFENYDSLTKVFFASLILFFFSSYIYTKKRDRINYWL